VTATRGVALGALLAAAVVLGVIVLGGGATHRYTLVFQNAGQLVKGNDVQVGGRRIGNVDSIDLTDDNQAKLTVSVADEFAPLHQGSTARIRATSLSGIANRYVELHPGPNSGRPMPDMAQLGTDSTTSIVDLDQLFNTLDARTRRGLQQVFAGSRTQFAGREKLANDAARLFNPAISTTARLVNEVNLDTQAFTDFVVQTSRVMTALEQRKGDLTNLVTNANTTTGAIGAESRSLSADLRQLPPTLRRANTTFVNVRAALGDLNPLVSAAKPATRRLAPLLRDLRPLVARARPTIGDLRFAINAPGPANDLIDLLHKTPRLGRQARVVFPRAVATLKRSQRTIEFIRPYVPELVGWIRDFGQGASNYDANGHYARIQPIFNAFTLNDNTLAPALANTRLKLYGLLPGAGTGNLQRCPGAATQPRSDGSNPFEDMGPFTNADCDKSQVPPGP